MSPSSIGRAARDGTIGEARASDALRRSPWISLAAINQPIYFLVELRDVTHCTKCSIFACVTRAGQHVTCISAILRFADRLNDRIAFGVGCSSTSHPFFAK